MFNRLPGFAVAAALALSIGLHWGLLQSVAWVEMLVTYSHDAGMAEALAETFDGRHPCCLCKAIAKARQSEKKSQYQPPLKKFECLAAQPQLVLPGASGRQFLPLATGLLDSVLFSPPTPPPRLRAA